ncbi:MAG TPA: prepilin-type N-terminal cleavage/methylation domain-containing protein [Thermotogota bacterium]|nr:prepilin-type N-terminal cleavage/methylation domain-containing protein [Thermotogota bacterium]
MRRAFTIIELLIVLGIIALLTSIVIKVSTDAVIQSRALQVAVNLTAIMKAAQSRLLTNDATTSDIGELDVDFESLTEYSLDMDYRENDATVEVKVFYSGIVSKNHIAGILDPDASIQAEGNKIAYSKVFPVYW